MKNISKYLNSITSGKIKKNNKTDKNTSVKSLIIMAVLLILIISVFVFTSCSVNLVRTEETRDKMGTYVNVTFYSSLKTPEDVTEGSFKLIDDLSKILSNYDPESIITRLNNEGCIAEPPKELTEVISLSKEYNEITKGAFEISINPVLDLWSEGLWKESEEIQQQKISEALELVGSDKIIIDGNSIKLEKTGMSLTLGGIAKGYIVDKMIEYIKSCGVKNALVNAGGDIMALGSKPNNEKWTISLENPDNTEEKIAAFGVKDMAVATSGNYYRYFDPSQEVSHIIDPRTGYTADQCISTTIIARSATVADILATSIFVLGPVEGMELVESLENVEALIIDKDGNIIKSSGIDEYIIEE